MNTRAGSSSQNSNRPTSSMNAYGAQGNPRGAPRLQNSRSTGLGGGNAGSGWAFGAPSSFGGGLGAGGAPGLGQVRPGQLSGFAQVMGGGSGQAPLDMRDFPSLSGDGGVGVAQNNPAAQRWGDSDAIRQATTQARQGLSQTPIQQQQPRAPSTAPSHHSIDRYDIQRSQQASIERNGGGEEFPPLHNQVNGNAIGQTNGFASSFNSPLDNHSLLNGLQAQLPIRDASSIYATSHQAPIGSGQSQPPQSINTSQTTANPTAKRWADMTEHEMYGFVGLNARIECKRRLECGEPIDETMPAAQISRAMLLVHDLGSLGIDLESTEPIYPNFHVFPNLEGSGSMFDMRDRHPVPAFTLSDSYTVNNVPPLIGRMTSMSDETLLQIFFQMTGSVDQELAAQELSNREWRWHKVLHSWLQRDTREANQNGIALIDHTNGAPIGTPPVRIDDHTERGIYILLDHQNWRRERRELTLDHEHLDNRVQLPPTAAVGLGGGMPPAPGFANMNSSATTSGSNQLFNGSTVGYSPATETGGASGSGGGNGAGSSRQASGSIGA